MKKFAVLGVSLALGLCLTSCNGAGAKKAETTAASTEKQTEAAAETTKAEAATDAPNESAEKTEMEVNGDVQMGQVLGALNGDRGFGQVTAVVEGDTIVAAYIDEYQFMPKTDAVGLPGYDGAFGQNVVGDVVLASKRVNTDYYSQLMEEYAKATTPIDVNFDAIQNFVVGKSIAEIEGVAGQDNAVDAVSGATLADTANYLKAIADAAKAAQKNNKVSYSGNTKDLSLNQAFGNPHDNAGVGTATVLTDGKTVILAYLDEFQFLPKEDKVVAVPNSDGELGKSYKEGQVLASKRENNEYYSDLMKQYANATGTIAGGYDAIQEAVDGKSVSDVKAMAGKDKASDAVSSATLADTLKYLELILEAAK